jgi:hypothetical protein
VKTLASALNSPADGLSKLSGLGITFNEVQKEQIKLLDQVGMKAEAQAKILEEIRRQFGGAGIDYGNTVAGQLDILSANIGDLKKAIGETLANAIIPLIKEINGTDSLSQANQLSRQSGVTVQANKISELSDIDRQIGLLSGQRRRIQDELRANQGTILGSLGAWSGFTVSREDEIQRLLQRERELTERRMGVAPLATQQGISDAQQRRLRDIDQQQNRAFFGFLAQGGALGGVNAQAQVTAEDVGMAIGRQIRGIAAGQDWNPQAQQARETSLQATESRFLTRGRGQLTAAEQKNLEEQKKQTDLLRRIEWAFANFATAENLLVVEGVN